MSVPDPVFNELSAHPPATSPAEARTRVSAFITVLVLAPDHGLGSSLRTSGNFYLLSLAPGYTLFSWLDDPQTSREEMSLFLSLAAKSPFLQPSDTDALRRAGDCEASFGGRTDHGLAAAHLLDVPLVSFHHGEWIYSSLESQISRLDDDGEIFTETVLLPNISCPEHYEVNQPWFKRRFPSVTDLTALWNNRESLFPELIFCPSVQAQLSDLEDILSLVLDRLKDLQRVASHAGPFDPASFASRCSPTSSSTRQGFERHYIFRAPDGVGTFCGWHLYLPDGRRIYFALLKNHLLIGHIGHHLPTKRFPA